MSALAKYDWNNQCLIPSAEIFVIIEANWGVNSGLFWVNLTKIGAKIAVLGSVAYPEFRLNS